MSNTAVLSGRNISIHFGKRTILDNIDIDIRAGEVTSLLGPNGAGKSTLLKTLSGEISSLSPIQYFGQERKQWLTTTFAKHVALLPQHSALSFPFLAKEVVELGTLPLTTSYKENSDLALHYMEKTGVLHLAEQPYPGLSGGEKQRLHLARVLAQLHQAEGKQILMLDEPTSALDIACQHRTLSLVREIAVNNNAAVVMVLHDLNLASQYSDRIILLHKGKILCDDTPWKALTSAHIEQAYGYQAIVARHPTLSFPQVHSAA
ncbi:heme ABC transporter ATP-binding protein [Vibrio sagamiensis]|uniref:Hemin import ATP-binding protein HmuV n=1 Tax=Vibrio sagamiensis NBRC 104589 TaxID=1219064 RepID=A0A511QES0_9VIBR|nr:heme ABC transporter ATP-binding protein [Vibrio sagamiensis]PNQ60903.1 heme ABC transporter ATP-binding protein [Vibrio agarivorans]GEM75801.1 hemin import ATP-binding protein HmuV [Vibrio sagamiensis NBRC 104589]